MEQTEQIPQMETEQMPPMPKLDDGWTSPIAPPPEDVQAPTEAIQTTSGTEGVAFSSKPQSPYYTEDEFYEQFKSCFQLAGDMSGIKSLPIKQNEEIQARATAHRIYLMATKYKVFNFLIDRRSSAVGEIVLMAQFVYMKANAVYEEKKGEKLGSKLWSKIFRRGKIKAKDTAYSAQVAPEKQQKQEKLSETANG